MGLSRETQLLMTALSRLVNGDAEVAATNLFRPLRISPCIVEE